MTDNMVLERLTSEDDSDGDDSGDDEERGVIMQRGGRIGEKKRTLTVGKGDVERVTRARPSETTPTP